MSAAARIHKVAFGGVGHKESGLPFVIVDTFDNTITASDETIVTATNGRLSDSGHSWEKHNDIAIGAATVLDATDELNGTSVNGGLISEVPASLPTRLTAEFKTALTTKSYHGGFVIRSNNILSPNASVSYECDSMVLSPNITAGIYIRNGATQGRGVLIASTVQALTGDATAYRECEVTDDGNTITYTDSLQAGLSVSLETTTYNTQKMVGVLINAAKCNNFKVYL